MNITMPTASELLADATIQKLVAAGLIVPTEGAKIVGKFGAGKLREEDWRMAVENSIKQEEKE